MADRGRPRALLELTDTERETLTRWSRRRKSAQALALRCRIVLECADGSSNKDVAARLGIAVATVGKWRGRFVVERLDGLTDEPRPGAPRTVSDDAVEAVIVKTLESTPKDATHWSTRSMAQDSGLSQSTVSRIWRTFGLQPHRGRDVQAVHRPALCGEKVYDVVGLYLDQPEIAVVLSVDEQGPVGGRYRDRARHVSSTRPPSRTCVSARIRASRSPRLWGYPAVPDVLLALGEGMRSPR